MSEALGVGQMYYPHLAMTTLLWLTVPVHSDGQRHAVGGGGGGTPLLAVETCDETVDIMLY